MYLFFNPYIKISILRDTLRDILRDILKDILSATLSNILNITLGITLSIILDAIDTVSHYPFFWDPGISLAKAHIASGNLSVFPVEVVSSTR